MWKRKRMWPDPGRDRIVNLHRRLSSWALRVSGTTTAALAFRCDLKAWAPGRSFRQPVCLLAQAKPPEWMRFDSNSSEAKSSRHPNRLRSTNFARAMEHYTLRRDGRGKIKWCFPEGFPFVSSFHETYAFVFWISLVMMLLSYYSIELNVTSSLAFRVPNRVLILWHFYKS